MITYEKLKPKVVAYLENIVGGVLQSKLRQSVNLMFRNALLLTFSSMEFKEVFVRTAVKGAELPKDFLLLSTIGDSSEVLDEKDSKTEEVIEYIPNEIFENLNYVEPLCHAIAINLCLLLSGEFATPQIEEKRITGILEQLSLIVSKLPKIR